MRIDGITCYAVTLDKKLKPRCRDRSHFDVFIVEDKVQTLLYRPTDISSAMDLAASFFSATFKTFTIVQYLHRSSLKLLMRGEIFKINIKIVQMFDFCLQTAQH